LVKKTAFSGKAPAGSTNLFNGLYRPVGAYLFIRRW